MCPSVCWDNLPPTDSTGAHCMRLGRFYDLPVSESSSQGQRCICLTSDVGLMNVTCNIALGARIASRWVLNGSHDILDKFVFSFAACSFPQLLANLSHAQSTIQNASSESWDDTPWYAIPRTSENLTGLAESDICRSHVNGLGLAFSSGLAFVCARLWPPVWSGKADHSTQPCETGRNMCIQTGESTCNWIEYDWVFFLFAELALSFSCRSSPSDPFVCSFRLFEGQHLLPQASQSCSSPQCRIRSYGLSVSQFSLAASSNKGRIGRKTSTPYSPFRNGMLCHNCHVSILHNPFCLASPGGAELHCWAMFSHFQPWSSCVCW